MLMIRNTLILLALLVTLADCGYTILRHSDDARMSQGPSYSANKIGPILASRLRAYEQIKQDTLSLEDPYQPFITIQEPVGVDYLGRVRLRLQTDWTGRDVLDSLNAVDAVTESAERDNYGRGRYIVWLYPEVVTRVAEWRAVLEIEVLQRTAFTRSPK